MASNPLLVQQVKTFQRMSQGHKEAWWNWCQTTMGSSAFDPAGYPDQALQTFLLQVQAGAIPIPESTGKGLGKGGMVKGGKHDTNSDLPAGTAHVRYDDPAHAMASLALSGSELQGGILEVQMDYTKPDGKTVIITGLPHTVQWQELKDHFKQAGHVGFVDVGIVGSTAPARGKGGGKEKTHLPTGSAEVRFDDPNHAMAALSLDGSEIQGQAISVEMDYTKVEGKTLIIKNVPQTCNWHEVKDHFKQIGPVGYVAVGENHGRKAALGGGGKGGNWGGNGGGDWGNPGMGDMMSMLGNLMEMMGSMGGKGKGKGKGAGAGAGSSVWGPY